MRARDVFTFLVVRFVENDADDLLLFVSNKWKCSICTWNQNNGTKNGNGWRWWGFSHLHSCDELPSAPHNYPHSARGPWVRGSDLSIFQPFPTPTLRLSVCKFLTPSSSEHLTSTHPFGYWLTEIRTKILSSINSKRWAIQLGNPLRKSWKNFRLLSAVEMHSHRRPVGSSSFGIVGFDANPKLFAVQFSSFASRFSHTLWASELCRIIAYKKKPSISLC